MSWKPSPPDRKLLSFDPKRLPRRPPRVVKREPPVERIACVFVGSTIALLGFTLAYFALSQTNPAMWIAGLIPGIPVLLIGTFGLSWIIQGLRGRSRHEGLFYWLLGHLIRLGPRPWALFLPVLSLAGVLTASLTDDPKGLEFALSPLLFWLVLMTHVAVHELGHVLAARLERLQVHRVIVGPFEFLRAPSWRLELSREWLSIGGGFVALLAQPERPRPRQMLVFAVGGPVATLILLVFFLALSPYDLATLLMASGPLRKSVFAAGVGLGLFALVVNLWPARQLVLGKPSDGYQILEAIRAIRKARSAGPSARESSGRRRTDHVGPVDAPGKTVSNGAEE
jgi:hypothetical protein